MHRDIKPSNVLVLTEGTSHQIIVSKRVDYVSTAIHVVPNLTSGIPTQQVIDFGISSQMKNGKISKGGGGTFDFMPPEVSYMCILTVRYLSITQHTNL